MRKNNKNYPTLFVFINEKLIPNSKNMVVLFRDVNNGTVLFSVNEAFPMGHSGYFVDCTDKTVWEKFDGKIIVENKK